MAPIRNLKDVTPLLSEVWNTQRFRIHYALRNPQLGPGIGAHGVHRIELIEAYARGLEALTNLRLRDGWPSPMARLSDGQVPVYVCQTSCLLPKEMPATLTRRDPDTREVESIVLFPSDSEELCWLAALERAEVEAAHEASHVLTHARLHHAKTARHDWLWFDEATAVFAELQILPKCRQVLSYAQPLLRSVDHSLTEFGGYCASEFVNQLTVRYGPGILWQIWSRCNAETSLIAAIESATTAVRRDETDESHSFGSLVFDYLLSIWNIGNWWPEAVERFGTPALAGSYVLDPELTTVIAPGDQSRPLSCRFYRLHAIRGGKWTVSIEILTTGRQTKPIDLRIVYRTESDSEWHSLIQIDQTTWSGEIPFLPQSPVVLSVALCEDPGPLRPVHFHIKATPAAH